MTDPVRPFFVRCSVSVLCLSALVLASGCGKSTGKVSGKVTLNGQPLKGGGTVTFEGSKGGVSGTITSEGTYTIVSAPEGAVKITLASGMGAGDMGGAETDPSKMRPPRKMAPAARAFGLGNIPEKYKKPETSGLTYTVTSGEQTFDIALTP